MDPVILLFAQRYWAQIDKESEAYRNYQKALSNLSDSLSKWKIKENPTHHSLVGENKMQKSTNS